MKKTITVGIVLFVIGALVGFGADRVYMKKKSAANDRQADQENAENKQDAGTESGADVAAGDSGGESGEKQEPGMSANDMPGAAAGVSLTGQIGTPIGQNSVSVEDQKPGSLVTVQSFTLGTDGWVVIHDDVGSKPGHILGAHRFNVGTYTGQNVELLKGTEKGSVYYVMLHADDGDRQFDYRVDLPLKDETGNMVMMRFVATSKVVQ